MAEGIPERHVELRGFPIPPSFTLGGKLGNVVISSDSGQVHRGWRCLAIDGKRMQGAELTAALRAAQSRAGKYVLTFKPVIESKVLRAELETAAPLGSEQDGSSALCKAPSREASHRPSGSRPAALECRGSKPSAAGDRAPAATRAVGVSEILVGAPTFAPAGSADAPARAPDAAAPGAAAAAPSPECANSADDAAAPADASPACEGAPPPMQVRLRAFEAATGLPPRASVAEPQRLLLAALARPSTHARRAPASEEEGEEDVGPCDRCGGGHSSAVCPHFKQPREDHRDAWLALRAGNSGEGGEDAPSGDGGAASAGGAAGETLVGARPVPQPGDGSCLFHSMSHGLGLGLSKAGALRRELSDFIAANPRLEVGESPLEDWVLWDAEMSVAEYAARMRSGHAWGGAIEMAVCARARGVDVRVYERTLPGTFVCICAFQGGGGSGAAKPVRLLYGGRVHYDALETEPGWWDLDV
ncbi:hypothetical protein KFE25_007538 [Diacronema lutheri]|uniref:Ubiquitin thioesterase OTU n=2 Tax=Diacronema lutheri TaxID=2081491 RepID=A0A8J5XW34_DIALT|nr:hypothetical protein KFE25_007538 [Diacronema lutheri]